MSPVIARKAMEMLKQTTSLPKEEKSKPPSDALLSYRELDILKELATGSNIYNKLHVDSRIQVISVAQKNKWVYPPNFLSCFANRRTLEPQKVIVTTSLSFS